MKALRKLLILCAICACLIGYGLYSTYALEVTHYTVKSPALPNGFDGFKIAHISDLHNTEFGKDNAELLSAIQKQHPDIIVVTGDILDSYDLDLQIAIDFMKQAATLAPCYYVCGNHELRLPEEYSRLKSEMKAFGVTVLEDNAARIYHGDASIQVVGLMDYRRLDESFLDSLFQKDGYTLMLTHRPEHFEKYQKFGADLVLAGHTHGGQIQIPFIGAAYAPGQGAFPDYAEGQHQLHNCSMIVSRGLGNSSIPFRFHCRPELAIISLYCQ